MFRALEKTIRVCLIGLGIGILLVLLLPISGWLFTIGLLIVIVGLMWLSCKEGEWIVNDDCCEKSSKMFKRYC